MDAKVVIAAHKPYWTPDDPAYLPLQVGASGKPSIDGFARDDEGENISDRNPRWCELTALYWAWKNLRADAVGLVHYRRHFRGRSGVATGAEIAALLDGADAILPKKRRYYLETTYSHYAHAHHAEDLDETRRIVEERHPECVEAFDRAMRARGGHRFNMFVMRRGAFDEYCGWLFGILFELERRRDISAYSAYDARMFGFVAERLLDVWLGAHPELRTVELPVMHLESQHWPAKALRFLLRKIRG